MNKTVFFLLGLLPVACSGEGEKPLEQEILKIDVMLESSPGTAIFQNGASVGCFLLNGEGDYEDCPCNQNVPAFLAGSTWFLAKETAITSSGSILAYYPYNEEAVDRTRIPVETASQTDYLYCAKEGFSSSRSEVTLRMKHALSLVRFNISNLPGRATAVRFDEVCVSGILDMDNGSLSNEVIKSETYEVKHDTIAVMAFPHERGNVHVSFIAGGKEYSFSATGGWTGGKEISYTVSFESESKRLLSVGDVTIEDWKVKGNYELY